MYTWICSPYNYIGTLSAWYVWGALGLYPLSGTKEYFVGSPAVEKATIHLPRTVRPNNKIEEVSL